MSPSLVVAEKTPVAAPVSPWLRGYPKWLLCVPEIGFLDGSLRPAQYCWLVTGKLLAWTVECFALQLSFLMFFEFMFWVAHSFLNSFVWFDVA